MPPPTISRSRACVSQYRPSACIFQAFSISSVAAVIVSIGSPQLLWTLPSSLATFESALLLPVFSLSFPPSLPAISACSSLHPCHAHPQPASSFFNRLDGGRESLYSMQRHAGCYSTQRFSYTGWKLFRRLQRRRRPVNWPVLMTDRPVCFCALQGYRTFRSYGNRWTDLSASQCGVWHDSPVV